MCLKKWSNCEFKYRDDLLVVFEYENGHEAISKYSPVKLEFMSTRTTNVKIAN